MDTRLGETNKAMQEGSRAQFRESRELIQEINREKEQQIIEAAAALDKFRPFLGS